MLKNQSVLAKDFKETAEDFEETAEYFEETAEDFEETAKLLSETFLMDPLLQKHYHTRDAKYYPVSSVDLRAKSDLIAPYWDITATWMNRLAEGIAQQIVEGDIEREISQSTESENSEGSADSKRFKKYTDYQKKAAPHEIFFLSNQLTIHSLGLLLLFLANPPIKYAVIKKESLQLVACAAMMVTEQQHCDHRLGMHERPSYQALTGQQQRALSRLIKRSSCRWIPEQTLLAEDYRYISADNYTNKEILAMAACLGCADTTTMNYQHSYGWMTHLLGVVKANGASSIDSLYQKTMLLLRMGLLSLNIATQKPFWVSIAVLLTVYEISFEMLSEWLSTPFKSEDCEKISELQHALVLFVKKNYTSITKNIPEIKDRSDQFFLKETLGVTHFTMPPKETFEPKPAVASESLPPTPAVVSTITC